MQPADYIDPDLLTPIREPMQRAAREQMEKVEGQVARAVSHGYDRLAVYQSTPTAINDVPQYEVNCRTMMFDSVEYPERGAPEPPRGYNPPMVYDLSDIDLAQIRDLV